MVLAQALTFCVRILAPTKRNPSWEVVDNKFIEPVHAWDCGDLDDEDTEILALHDEDIIRSYLFEVHAPSDMGRAVRTAQQTLLREVRSLGYNALWREGWQVTLSRQAARLRIEVQYTARPATLSVPPLKVPRPPFVDVLNQLALVKQ